MQACAPGLLRLLLRHCHTGAGELRQNTVTQRFVSAPVETAYSQYRGSTRTPAVACALCATSAALAAPCAVATGAGARVAVPVAAAVVVPALLSLCVSLAALVARRSAHRFSPRVVAALGWVLVLVGAVLFYPEIQGRREDEYAVATMSLQIGSIALICSFFRALSWLLRLGVSLVLLAVPAVFMLHKYDIDFLIRVYPAAIIIGCVMVWKHIDREDFKFAYQSQRERQRFEQEKRTFAMLADSLLPPSVIEMFKSRTGTEAIAKDHQNAVLLVVEIAGFSRGIEPHETVKHLGILFDSVDEICDRYGCDKNGVKLHYKAALSIGSLTTGILGLDKPKFELFGDTVEVCSRMISQGPLDRVVMTLQFKTKLGSAFISSKDEPVFVKGCGKIETFHLLEYDTDHGTISKLVAEASDHVPIRPTHSCMDTDLADILRGDVHYEEITEIKRKRIDFKSVFLFRGDKESK
eukprot:m51a1_g9480 putative adenylate guanylate cyclase (466) ;mRNA; r:605894-607955